MRYFGIKSPKEDGQESPQFIGWIADSPHNAWVRFFADNPNRPPMSMAIRAYEAIGYECVELQVTEKPKTQSVRELGQEIDDV